MKLNIAILLLASMYNNIIAQNIGFGTNNPQAKLHLSSGDIFLENNNQGVIMKSPDRKCWKQVINNSGSLIFISIPCPGIDSFIYGGQTYSTRLMPDGRWWMTQNLNIGSIINSANEMTNNNIIEKYCYDNEPANCSIYGGLYQWYEVMQFTNAQSVKGICPNGWHIPTLEDWIALEASIPSPDKGRRLSGNHNLWTSEYVNNQYFETTDFIALPAGSHGDSQFYSKGYGTNFWLSTEFPNSESAYNPWLFHSFSIVFTSYSDKFNSHSVRCIKD